jgi:hypothetical protein
MKIFAKINQDSIVEDVVVANDTDDNPLEGLLGGQWVETAADGSIRKNYAGIGYTYDSQNDAFVPPQPYPSWILNQQTFRWDPPVPHPDIENKYEWVWDEPSLSWKSVQDVV